MPGGLWFMEAPETALMPFAVFTPVSNAPQAWTNVSEYTDHRFQIVVWDTGAEQLGRLLREIAGAIDFAPFSLDLDGEILLCQRSDERYLIDKMNPARQFFGGMLEYVATRRSNTDYNPS